MCQCVCRLHAVEAEPILSIFPSKILAICCLKTDCKWPLTAQTPSLHGETLMDFSVDGKHDYGQFMVVFEHISADCSSDPPLDSSLARAETDLPWRQSRGKAFEVSAGMPGVWHLTKPYTRSPFPLSAEIPRGSYLRKHGIPVRAIKQYSTATTQRVQTCNKTSLSREQVSEWVKNC